MSIKRSDKIKAILFLFVTTCLTLLLILSLVGTQWMKKQDVYYIEFSDPISGLNVGSQVRYHGVNVGKVRNIIFDMNELVTVSRITIEVMQNTPIKIDSKAILEIDSIIVGNRYIQITPGSSSAPLLEPNQPANFIPSEYSGLEVTAKKVESILDDMGPMMSNISEMFNDENANSVSSILVRVNTLIGDEDFSDKIAPLIDNVSVFFSPNNANAVSSILYQIDHILADNTANVAIALTDFQDTLNNINKSLEYANGIMSKNDRNIGEIMINLRNATDSANELIEKINRQPSILIRGNKNPEKKYE